VNRLKEKEHAPIRVFIEEKSGSNILHS